MVKQYKVRITRLAYNQIDGELYSPESAKKLLLNIKNAIGKLDSMPARDPFIEEGTWKSGGIRRLVVNNFYVYYWIEEDKELVHVTGVVYGKCDQIRQLTNMKLF